MKNTDIFGEWETYLISFLALCLFGTYLHFKYKLTYWNRRKIFQVPGRYTWVLLTKFILTKKSISELLAEIYKKGRDYRYIGFYTLLRPTLLIRDPELIKMIMVKDHEYFKDRGFSNNENENYLAAHLFFLNGLKWKYVHNKVNPIYSDDKMKFIFGTLKKCTEELNEHLKRLIRNNDEIDFKKLLADHSINVIANSVIGIEGHDLSSNSDFHKIAHKVTASNLLNVFRYISPMVIKQRSPFLTTKFTPSDIEKYYINLTKSIVEYRRKNNIVHHDLMHLLIETGENRTENGKINATENENELSLSEMAAQTFTFILSAYETNYSTICFCLYELAMNSKVQEKLQNEIDAAGSVKDVTYDKLLEFQYLDQVIKETWRKYPPSGIMFRECNKTYNLPHGKVIESGTTVIFSSLGLHRDPEYFPDPETFDPERFNKYLPTHRVKPYSFLPFGAGPRVCTGKLFAEMQSKLTLYSLVSQFTFKITNKTIVPPKFQPRTFLLVPAHGIYLQAIKRSCT